MIIPTAKSKIFPCKAKLIQLFVCFYLLRLKNPIENLRFKFSSEIATTSSNIRHVIEIEACAFATLPVAENERKKVNKTRIIESNRKRNEKLFLLIN